jgi:hypothetical protein
MRLNHEEHRKVLAKQGAWKGFAAGPGGEQAKAQSIGLGAAQEFRSIGSREPGATMGLWMPAKTKVQEEECPPAARG